METKEERLMMDKIYNNLKECEGINCPKYNSRCIAYGEIPQDCPLFQDNFCVKNCCNIRANEFWKDGYAQAHIDHPSVGQCEVEKLIGKAVEGAKAQQWQLDQEQITTLGGQIESLQADIARLEKQYEDSEKFLNREAAFEEQRLHEEVKYWKDKDYRLG